MALLNHVDGEIRDGTAQEGVLDLETRYLEILDGQDAKDLDLTNGCPSFRFELDIPRVHPKPWHKVSEV